MKKTFFLFTLSAFSVLFSAKCGLKDVVKFQKKLQEIEKKFAHEENLYSLCLKRNRDLKDHVHLFLSSLENLSEKNKEFIWSFFDFFTQTIKIENSSLFNEMRHSFEKKTSVDKISEDEDSDSFIDKQNKIIKKIKNRLLKIRFITLLEEAQKDRDVFLKCCGAKKKKQFQSYSISSKDLNIDSLKYAIYQKEINLFSFVRTKKEFLLQKYILIKELIEDLEVFIEVEKYNDISQEMVDFIKSEKIHKLLSSSIR